MLNRLKPLYWMLRKKAIRRWYVARGVFARSIVPLTRRTARRLYGLNRRVRIHSFVRPESIALQSPGRLPEDASFADPRFFFPLRTPAYDAVLLDVRDTRFTFRQSHLLDHRNRVIYFPQVAFRELPMWPFKLAECRRVRGTVAYLSNTLFCQYAHWIQLQLSLLPAYWEIVGREAIDYYYIGDQPIKPFALECLQQMGVRADQIIDFPCRADRSLISMHYVNHNPAAFQSGFEMSRFIFEFLRSRLFTARPPQRADGPCFRKIFVMRGLVNGRRERNLPEIRAALEPCGFHFLTTEGLTMQQEADLFGNADVVIAVHGAALHNLLFARSGTTVIEIFAAAYFEPSNYVIANHAGCHYHCLIGEPLDDPDPDLSFVGRNRTDVRVDPAKLLRLCRQAGVLSS